MLRFLPDNRQPMSTVLNAFNASNAKNASHADDEVLYESPRSVVLRRRLAGEASSVVVKRAIGGQLARRLRHEREVLQRLAGVPGVSQLAPSDNGGDQLVLRDCGGTPLGDVLASRELSVDDVLLFGARLARVLVQVHQRGVIHKDINPSNVLLGGEDGLQPALVDFNIAAAFGEERTALAQASQIAGTLAYMPPEQTGRTGQPVDHRSDLYALGGVLFRCIAGRTPFEAEDDMFELLRQQLTQAPDELATLVPGTPPLLSSLVYRLLEKEPDRRYQSAAGLAHDLERLIRERAQGIQSNFVLGERDFAIRLIAPSRPVGRDSEIAVLDVALRATKHVGVCLMVSGAAGVGKTSLVRELQPVLSTMNGRFASGRSDPHRTDGEPATTQALRSLARLLLSEPEESLAEHRKRLVSGLGSNIGVAVTQVPELGLLLNAQPAPNADPVETEARMLQASLSVLRTIASSDRPLVLVLDDMQWATEASVRLIDAVLAGRHQLPGLLLVLAYRPEAVEPGSALAIRLQRWSQPEMLVMQVELKPLPTESVSALVGQMLRLAPGRATLLGQLLSDRARGNPQDTIEFVNALKLDGVLEMDADGWRWDEAAIRRYVGESEGADVVQRRLEKMPAHCTSALMVLACLGDEAPQALLEVAADLRCGSALDVLAEAVEDGLLIIDASSGSTTLRMRNNRVQECAKAALAASGNKPRMQLALARRLARLVAYEGHAAQQYLDVLADLADASERRLASRLLRDAAQATAMSNYPASERCLNAAIGLLKSVELPEDHDALIALLSRRHLTLYCLGRLEEADEVYDDIVGRTDDLALIAETTGVQVHSLTNRLRWDEALSLGLKTLEYLGMPKPADLGRAVGSGLQEVRAWAMGEAKQGEFNCTEADNPRVLALAQFIKRMLVAAFHKDKAVYIWLMLESHRLWAHNGPSPSLMPMIASMSLLLVSALKDYRAAYAAARHAIELGRARGYEPGTSKAYIISALCATHWGEPVEEMLNHTQLARKGLLEANDTQYASYTFSVGTISMIECGETLDLAERQAEASIEFDTSTGNPSHSGSTIAFKQLFRAMRGASSRVGGFAPEDLDEAQYLEAHGAVPSSPPLYYIQRAMAAAIFNDDEGLQRYGRLGIDSGASLQGFYASTWSYLFAGLAYASRARSLDGDVRAKELADLDGCRAWMSARAEDVPENFSHLALLLDAERAWSVGDPWAASQAYERAMAEVDTRTRVWHRAYICERAARFHLAHRAERVGRLLLAEAMRSYDDWGAVGKVRQLVEEFPFLRTSSRGGGRTVGRSTIVSSDMVDMMAILRASQAISSETGLTQLNERMVQVMSAVCGAESVLLAVRPREMDGWYLLASLGEGNEPVSVEQAAVQGQVVLSAFRYAERTRKPLLLEDATRDHRFSTDPALQGAEHCSLLLVPILKQGEIQAMLVLESRMRQSAFSADRLDSVSLIAGQLIVSLDNALVYASLESKVAERTAALEEANHQLEHLSGTDTLTGLPNRRRFDQTLAERWQHAENTQGFIGLAMIDIDHFKQYNDHYGHDGGDACLKLVADAMKSVLRSGGDMIARYGGEEFVLLVSGGDLAGVRAAAERVRAAVAARQEPHAKAAHGFVSVSIGVAACVPMADMSSQACLKLADEALYRAKESGRNRVVVAEGETRKAPVRPKRADAPSAAQSLSLLTSSCGAGLVRWDARRLELFVSDEARQILGWPSHRSLRLSQLLRLLRPDTRARVLSQWKAAVQGGLARLEMQVELDEASHRKLGISALLNHAPPGRLSDMVLVLRDVSQQAAIAEAMIECRNRPCETEDIARLAYWEWNYATRQANFSLAALRMLGLPDDWNPSLQDLRELAPPDQREWVDSVLREAFAHHQPSLRYELQRTLPDGSTIYLHTVGKIEYTPQGLPLRLVATVQDVSEVRSYRRQLHSLSFFDTLTRLPNRALFVERLREAGLEAGWKNHQLGLLILDIDRFKDINDSFGHGAGDSLLQEVAERLQHVLRGYDTVGRLGGDEFAVLLPELRQPEDMNSIAQKVLGAFAMPFLVQGKETFVSTSVGGAMYPTHADGMDQLLQFADAALHHAKVKGRNNFQFYASELTDKAVGSVAMEGELRRGLVSKNEKSATLNQ